MDLQLRDRLVVVTGASAGIGAATALELAAAGARLVLGARDRDRLAVVAEKARAAGSPDVVTVSADLTTVDGVGALASATAQAVGGGALHGLVACVGSTPLGTFDEVDDEGWQVALTGKFLASVRVIRLAAEQLRRGAGGRIVLVAGNAARDAAPGMVTSTAVNAALAGLVASTGRLLAPEGIGLVALHPGPTRTARYASLVAHRAAATGTAEAAAETELAAQIANGRPAEPDEVAALAAYLVSPRAAHIVATTVTIDGGQTWG